jgi:SNF2 family DNA or RNA helicase
MVGKFFNLSQEDQTPVWRMTMAEAGIRLDKSGVGVKVASPLLQGYVAQLIDDGFAIETANGIESTWDRLYAALESPGYAELAGLLSLPAFTDLAPCLCSSGSLTDEHFTVSIESWIPPSGRARSAELNGALITQGQNQTLMRPEQWALVREVLKFAKRDAQERSDAFQRASWGRIRSLASKAGAHLDDFLDRTVVLTPERLEFALRKSHSVASGTVIEISPWFEGAPPDWLERFDARQDVPERYDISTDRGIVQVLVTPQVNVVLQEIKRLPGRRITGSRAEAFLLNPYAALGTDAHAVIDEKQFEEAKSKAGIFFERFTPTIEHDAAGHPIKIGLLIEAVGIHAPVASIMEWLTDEALGEFVCALESAIAGNHQLLGWNGYDLEIQGESTTYLGALKTALEQRKCPPPLISWEQVYDLSMYSERIEGIGDEKTYYSPYIAKKKDDESWFPENVDPYVVLTPEDGSDPILMPVSETFLKRLKELLEAAKAEGKEVIDVPGLPQPISILNAESITKTFAHVYEVIEQGEFEPDKNDRAIDESAKQRSPKTLILRSNIQALDYEVRRLALKAVPAEPEVPRGLRPDYPLLPHQLAGLAWLQHLHRAQDEYQVRGCVLADDMGLGKTFQLLAFMAWLAEQKRGVSPMLVVAPVSLLENWKEEVDKFIEPGVLPVLAAYGESLASMRVPRRDVDARLRSEDGLVNFLRPGWVGQAKVVLTTYETLRDLEFSFAAQRWSVMICDEAQKIKNPAAMVTRAAKKQKVDFKVACTGTPVENTLADLWCLFDFIQPGLLGALDEFGRRYRRPIEARNDEERIRVEELRERIAPQILRRTKAEVAKNLPQKIEDVECQRLKLSNLQRTLYAKAVEDFKRREEPGAVVSFKNHLGLLHYLRLICTDPRQHGFSASATEPLKAYQAKAPKLDWLVGQLAKIEMKGDKAIVFCEFRDIQRLLQHYIAVAFNYKPDIINGDTSAAAECNDNRQRRIRAFQAKSGFGVIILSPLAVGFGVNIQGANHVVHYTRTWNPAKEDQATDRAYRIGQTKDVYVYCPVVRADDFSTFDVKLDELLRRKRVLATDMLNGAGDLDPGDFEIGDVVPGGAVAGINPRIDIDATDRMTGRYFEALVAALWSKQNNSLALCTPYAGDHGVDVIAIAGDQGVLIQTKQSSLAGGRLGWDVVKEVLGGEAFYRRQYPNVNFTKVGLTNQHFNENAHDHARLNGILLIERPTLERLLEQYCVNLSEVERHCIGFETGVL